MDFWLGEDATCPNLLPAQGAGPLNCILATDVGIPGGRRLAGVVGEAAGAGEMKGRRQVDSGKGKHPGLRGSQAFVPHTLACPLWAEQELTFPRAVPVTSPGGSTPQHVG